MPPLVVIRSGSKYVEYLENRSAWRRTPDTESCNMSDDEAVDDESFEDVLRQAEETWGCISNNTCDKAFGYSREQCDVEGLHAFHCADCGNLVADYDDIVSKTFTGRTGKAFLMNNMYNIHIGSACNRYLMTGMHSVADVLCSQCDVVLGWKYLKAMESSQKYKEGKFVLEQALVDNVSEEKTWNRL